MNRISKIVWGAILLKMAKNWREDRYWATLFWVHECPSQRKIPAQYYQPDPKTVPLFSASGENFLPLTMFVSFILRDQLAWDLHLGLAPEQVGAMRLGDNKSALLGWTSFLGTPEERPSVTIRVRS